MSLVIVYGRCLTVGGGGRGGIRTRDHRVKSPALSLAELRALFYRVDCWWCGI